MKGKQIQVYVSEDIDLWLEEKAKQGYKKATLIRHIISEYKKAEYQSQA